MHLIIAPFVFTGLLLRLYNNSKKDLSVQKGFEKELQYYSLFLQNSTQGSNSNAGQIPSQTTNSK
jgi:hypothetical protein